MLISLCGFFASLCLQCEGDEYGCCRKKGMRLWVPLLILILTLGVVLTGCGVGYAPFSF